MVEWDRAVFVVVTVQLSRERDLLAELCLCCIDRDGIDVDGCTCTDDAYSELDEEGSWILYLRKQV